MTGTPLRTPLHDWHAAHNGRLVEFAGWMMPIQFTSIVREHTATRTAIGLFDISHMGRLRLDGPAAAALLDRLVTRRVAKLKPGLIRYGLVTNEQAGILDDVLVYHLAEPAGGSRWMMVVNAGNRAKIVRWIGQHQRADEDVQLTDLTLRTAMIAVQGPKAVALIDALLDVDLAHMKYYHGAIGHVGDQEVVVSRTGYTGEDGCELMVTGEAASGLWRQILDAGRSQGAVPVGLGARDTLRLEAGMPLYGHELTESIHPLQADLAFAVQLDRHEFIGRAALVAARQDTSWPRRVGLILEGRRVAREQSKVLRGDQEVGEVTSGTFSPTLERPIAMAYVPADTSAPGTKLTIDVRGHRTSAEVVELPFYSRLS